MKSTIIGLLLSAGIATFPVTGALAQSSTQIKGDHFSGGKEVPGDHFSNAKKVPGDHFSE